MKTGQVIAGVAVGCVLLAAALVVAAVALFTWLAATPEGAELAVEAPIEAAVGEPFELVVTVGNSSPEAKELVDVDIADEYLAGLAVRGSRPPFADSMHVPLDETVSYSMNLPIQAGGEVRVVFEMLPLHAGDFTGEVDACVDSEVRCMSHVVRTVVLTEAAGDT
jgi:hypothetical protein